MQRFKTLGLIALVVIAMTAAVLGLSYVASPRLSPEMVKNTQSFISESLSEKLVNAEGSLIRQGSALASDPKLTNAIAEVRAKLITTKADDLKKQSNNTWNDEVFKLLTTWRQERASALTLWNSAQRLATEDSPRATALDRFPLENWWNRAPDLLLAFANVPLVDDPLPAATMIAYGLDGKQLRAGKSYEHEIPVLREVQKTNQPILGLFAWDNKMFFAVTSPVNKLNETTGQMEQIGLTVLGMELTRETIDVFIDAMPPHMNLMIYYMAHHAGGNSYRHYSKQSDDTVKRIRDTKYRKYSDFDNKDAQTFSFDGVSNSDTYIGDVSDRLLAFTRARWLWDETQEVGFYTITDLDKAANAWTKFRSNVLIAGLLFLIAALLLGLFITSKSARKLQELKVAILEAINSGNPINADAFTCLPGIEHVNIGNYIIKSIDDDSASDPNADMSLLLTDLDMENEDESIDATSDSSKTPDAQPENDENVDPEMKALYDDYMQKRKDTGNDTPMPYDQFLRRISRNREKLEAAHPGTKIVFVASVQNGKAVLTPSIKK